MSRMISRLAVACVATFGAIDSLFLHAADKGVKANPAAGDANRQVANRQVIAALRAEAAGDNERRAELLNSAVRAEPDLAEANWHLARVRIGNRWLTLDNAQQEAASDPQLAEYRKLRDEADGNSKRTRGLARWCLKAGLDDLARLHYAQLLARSDVDADTQAEAIRRLDLHNVGGTWVTGSELKQRQDRAEHVEAAIRQWRPSLKRLQLVIDEESSGAGEKAIRELTTINDPKVILVLQSLLAEADERFSEEAVKVFARFPHIESTEALARVAVMSPYPPARSAAVAELKKRTKQDYMQLLLSGLLAPVKMQFSIQVNARGAVEYSQAIGMEEAGARYISIQSQSSLPMFWSPRRRSFSIFGRADPVNVGAEVNNAASRAQLASTETELTNMQIAEANRRTFDVLEQLSGATLSRDATQYWDWWQDYNQYYWPKPTFCAYQQQPSTYYYGGVGSSCFVAGTLVRTQLGLLPIEAIKAGDRVLAQDQDSGELAFKPVLRTTLRPPRKMVCIRVAGDEIIATVGHPFWVAGTGWKMAKELRAGDFLHGLDSAIRIEKVEPAGEDNTYNLVVDDFNTYFVGQQGLLVHDNEFRKPTRAIVPGLLDESVAAAAAAKN
ncbi:MAG TPA: polymorphic toxin-type HINT domain-containing protein [Pirellulaceae bacterium]